MAPKRILFIDGDEAFITGVAAAAGNRGFETTTTGSSTDGVELAKSDRPDLIVVNVELAPTNGWSVCTKLKKDDELKDIPVVLTSSSSTADTFEKHKKLKTRADEYLIKPYTADDFLRVAGALVGLPELPAPEEEMIVEDEPLGDGGALDEESIAVGDDEPLDGGLADEEFVADEAPAEEMLADDMLPEELVADEAPLEDPLAFDDGSLGEELAVEASVEAPALESAPSEDDELAAFDQSFDSIAAGPENDAAEVTVAEEGVEGESPAYADLPTDELGGELAADGVPEEMLAEEMLAEEMPAEELAAEEPLAETEAAFGEEPLAFEEAPLEISANEEALDEEPFAGEAVGEDSLAAGSFGDGESFAEQALESSDGTMEGSGDGGSAEFHARIAELEAELAGYREADTSRDDEIERIRQQASKKDRELLEVREQLHQKDRELLDVKENESKLTSDAAKARDERTRREATVKSLTAKAEQLSLQAAKLQKELVAAREEAKGGAALKTKLAEAEKAAQAALEKAQAETQSARADAEQARTELDQVRGELAVGQAEIEELKASRDAAAAEADGLRQDLEEARRTAERALANAVALQEKLAHADERAEQHAVRVKGHEENLGKTREALQKLLSEIAPS